MAGLLHQDDAREQSPSLESGVTPARVAQTPVSLAKRPTIASRFQGFGQSLITKAARKPLCSMRIAQDRLEARKNLRELVPRMPGVYGWLDPQQQLVYVGKSKSLRSRLLQYFDRSPPDTKMERIRDQSKTIVWETTSHELLALIREQELIVRHRPNMNVQGQPTRRQPGFICVSEGIAPKVYLARRLNERTKKWFGPISGTGQLDSAITSVNYAFQLRDCADKTKFRFNNQLQLFESPDHAKCLRFELNTCPAPCAGACSKQSYGDNVTRAIGFLEGDRSVIDRLDKQMETMASKQAYERAAVIRDQLEALVWVSNQLGRLRQAEQLLNGVYEIPGLSNRPLWLWLKQGEIIGCWAKSRSIPRPVWQRFEQPNHQTGMTQNILNTYLKLMMVSWFRKYPDEKSRLLGVEIIPDLTNS